MQRAPAAPECRAAPFIFKWVAAMPDVHWGIGATVGSVIPTKGAIIPAAVGVDIGCGMMAVQTSLNARDLPDNLKGIRTAIETAVPHGRTNHGGAGDRGAWHDIPERNQEGLAGELKARLRRDSRRSIRSWIVEITRTTSARSEPATISSRSAWMNPRLSGSCFIADRAESAIAWAATSSMSLART